jgi:hypothetical protein
MKNKDRAGTGITRRKFLPFLGGGFFLPFLGSAATTGVVNDEDDLEYQTMLTKDGTVVKVKISAINNSPVVDKKVSNRSLLNWLKKNDTGTKSHSE